MWFKKGDKMKTLVKKELIDEYIRKNKLTKTQFCKLCNVDIRTLRNIYSGDIDFQIIFLFRVARRLNVGIGQLLNDIMNEKTTF